MDSESYDIKIAESGLKDAYADFGNAVRKRVSYSAKNILTQDAEDLLSKIQDLEKEVFPKDDVTRSERKTILSQYFMKLGNVDDFLISEYARQQINPAYNGDKGTSNKETLQNDISSRLIATFPNEDERTKIASSISKSVLTILRNEDDIKLNLDKIDFSKYDFIISPDIAMFAVSVDIACRNEHKGSDKELSTFVEKLGNLGLLYGLIGNLEINDKPFKEDFDVEKANKLSEKAGVGRAEAERIKKESSRRVEKGNEKWADWVKAGAGAALLVTPALMTSDTKKSPPSTQEEKLTFGKVVKTTAIVLAPFVGLYLLSTAMNNWQTRSMQSQAGNQRGLN